MYLDQDGNIVCNQSIYYAAIRRSEDDFTLPMSDPSITNSYMGLAYDIERNGLEDKAYPAVRRHVDTESEIIMRLLILLIYVIIIYRYISSN